MNRIEARFVAVDGRFVEIDTRLAHVDARLAQVDARFAQVDRRFERLEDRMSSQFRWLVGLQVMTLVGVIGGLFGIVSMLAGH
jgi:hypothetical protein